MHTLNPWDNKHIVRSSGLTKPSGLYLRGPDEMPKSPHKAKLPREKEVGQAWNHDVGLGLPSLEELR